MDSVEYRRELELDEQVKRAGFDMPFFSPYFGPKPSKLELQVFRIMASHNGEWRNFWLAKIRAGAMRRSTRAFASSGQRTKADGKFSRFGEYWRAALFTSLN